MMSAIAAEDRFAVEDILGRYVLAIDLGDADAALALFTDDAIVRYDNGQAYEGLEELRVFVRRAIGSDAARRRMHFNRTLYAEADEADIVLRSYLAVPEADAHGEGATIATLRYVEDRFVRTAAGWRMQHRLIHRWPASPTS